MSQMYEGRAVGGPRNGVKLSAGHSWDGIVYRATRQHDEYHSMRRAHPGRYIWQATDGTWLWITNEATPGSRVNL